MNCPGFGGTAQATHLTLYRDLRCQVDLPALEGFNWDLESTKSENLGDSDFQTLKTVDTIGIKTNNEAGVFMNKWVSG